MKKILLLAALFAAVLPGIKAQDATGGETRSLCVGEFDNPGEQERKMGAGSWWEHAPFQFYTKYSGIQIIYEKEYLQPILDDKGEITEILFKMSDDGSFVEIESDLTLYVQNTDAVEFEKKEDTNIYKWITFDENSSCAKLEFEYEFYYGEDFEYRFVLDKPLKYEGKNLLVTAWSDRINDEETQALVTYAMKTNAKTTMAMGSDWDSFLNAYASGYEYPYIGDPNINYPLSGSPYQGPNNYVPVTKFVYTAGTTGIGAVGAEAVEAAPRYYNLQGQAVSGDLAPGIYVCKQGNETKKLLVK